MYIHLIQAEINQCAIKADALDLSVLSERLNPKEQVAGATWLTENGLAGSGRMCRNTEARSRIPIRLLINE